MANVTLYKQDGSENGKVELNDAIWAVEPNENVVFDAVVMQRASLRQGTHAVKTVLLFLAAVASLGAKRVLVVPAKVQSAARNGVAVGSSSDRPRAAMHTSCQRRFVVWQSNPYFHRRFSIATWSLLTV
jgi:hypothetical protein